MLRLAVVAFFVVRMLSVVVMIVNMIRCCLIVMVAFEYVTSLLCMTRRCAQLPVKGGS